MLKLASRIRGGLHGYALELVTEYRKVLKEKMLFVVCLNCGNKRDQSGCRRNKKVLFLESLSSEEWRNGFYA